MVLHIETYIFKNWLFSWQSYVKQFGYEFLVIPGDRQLAELEPGVSLARFLKV